MIEALNITDAYYRVAVKQAAPVAEVETTEARPVKKPTRVNDVSAKDDKNRMSASFDMSAEDRKYLQELKERDREVREHEMAHKRVAGQYAGAVTYTYQTGPDNKQYAIGGKTQLDTSEEPTPEENIVKQEIIYDAALAPKDPSSKDKEVARDAQQSAKRSKVELAQQEAAERREELEEQAEAAEEREQTVSAAETESAVSADPLQPMPEENEPAVPETDSYSSYPSDVLSSSQLNITI